MTASKSKKESPNRSFVDNERMGARRGVIEELFNDMYDDRRNIYKMNFIRGIFFGIGSVIGGTIFVALALAILSQFVDWFPVLGDFVSGILDAMNSRK
jgi:hypothetical protein